MVELADFQHKFHNVEHLIHDCIEILLFPIWLDQRPIHEHVNSFD